MILYGLTNIEGPTFFFNLVKFLRPYVEHESINCRAIIHVDRTIAMVLRKLAFGYSNKHIANIILCWAISGLKIYFYYYKGFS